MYIYMSRDSALFKMVTLSLTTALCNWSISTCAQIFAICRWSEWVYTPVTPITIGIKSTFFRRHSLLSMFAKSAYFVALRWIVVVMPMSLVIPTSMIWASLVILL